MSNRKLIQSNEYKGFKVNVGQEEQYRLDRHQLDRTLGELGAMLINHSRVFMIRFDLHFPADWVINPKAENDAVSGLLEALRFKCRSKYGKIATGWVREIETAKNCHYHLFMLFDGNKARKAGVLPSGDGKTGVGIVNDIAIEWQRLTSGSIYVCGSTMVHRNNFEEINSATYWLSYLAKERGKRWSNVRPSGFSRTRCIPKSDTAEHLLGLIYSGGKRSVGRPPKYGSDVVLEVQELVVQGMPLREISEKLGISKSTVQRYATKSLRSLESCLAVATG